MKIIPKNIAHKFLLPVPVFTSVYIAEAFSKEGEDFSVFVGLEKKYVDQVRNHSLDPYDGAIQNNTQDRMRFGEGSYEEWYKKNRTPFCLIHTRTDTLAALIWLGEKPLDVSPGESGPANTLHNWHTAAFRSYPPFRGTGLMKEFAAFVMDVYKRNFENVNFWIVTNADNTGMLALAETLGFELSPEHSNTAPGRLILIKRKK